jgi:peptidylprolyl isomerase domain and WD repeat-containing protein 1
MEFGRRLAIEREISQSGSEWQPACFSNVIFDESGNFILYPTLLGIKVVNLKSNKVERVIGFLVLL